jgi:ribulose-phosphate 3-epimerase
MSKVDIFPSILNADWDHMAEELAKLETAGANGIHLDIMDGKFVPEKTFDLKHVKKFVGMSSLPFDAHLMIEEPQKHVDSYIECGVDSITFHYEVCRDQDAIDLARHIQVQGLKAGISINPDGKVGPIMDLIDYFDWVLFMSVVPGYGGQKFIPEVLDNVMQLKAHCNKHKLKRVIQIDGGINEKTAPLAIGAGINNIVAGTYIVKSDDYAARIKSLRKVD